MDSPKSATSIYVQGSFRERASRRARKSNHTPSLVGLSYAVIAANSLKSKLGQEHSALGKKEHKRNVGGYTVGLPALSKASFSNTPLRSR